MVCNNKVVEDLAASQWENNTRPSVKIFFIKPLFYLFKEKTQFKCIYTHLYIYQHYERKNYRTSYWETPIAGANSVFNMRFSI